MQNNGKQNKKEKIALLLTKRGEKRKKEKERKDSLVEVFVRFVVSYFCLQSVVDIVICLLSFSMGTNSAEFVQFNE